MSSRAGLFLDLDGTLADSLTVMRDVYGRFLGEYGVRGSDAEFAELNGPPLAEVVRILVARHKLTAPGPELVARYMSIVQKEYLEVKPNAGAVELAAFAAEQGWTRAVVTSNSEALTRKWLERNGFAIEVVIGQESIRAGKPDPGPYLEALKRTGCEAAKSIAVEDAPAGVESATRAGLRTFVYAPKKASSGSGERISSLLELKRWLTRV